MSNFLKTTKNIVVTYFQILKLSQIHYEIKLQKCFYSLIHCLEFFLKK